jgi:hypothetical protein
MLEFQFILDEKFKLWLYKVNPKAKFKLHKTIQDVLEEDLLRHVFSKITPKIEQIKNSEYIMPSLA